MVQSRRSPSAYSRSRSSSGDQSQPKVVSALLDAFAVDRPAGESRELDFMPWAGAYNRVPADATAFVHRQERFQLKHAVTVEAGASPEARRAARAGGSFVGFGASMESGRVFQNFADGPGGLG